MPDAEFILANVRIGNGLAENVSVRNNRLYRHVEINPGATVIQGHGGLLIPGLVDHHVHLMAEAVRLQSVDLSSVPPGDFEKLKNCIVAASIAGPIRAIGLDDGGGELLDVAALDAITLDQPLRIQYRTGGLWVLNSVDLSRVLRNLTSIPSCFERDRSGRLNGRIWRGDRWIRQAGSALPSFARLARVLTRWGVTAITDASITNDQIQADSIAQAATGKLPQHLTIMSGGAISSDTAWQVGPVKILLDEAKLPKFDDLVASIRFARSEGRSIAVHAVTPIELGIILAAWDIVGVEAGDRLEHGFLIPAEAVQAVADLGVTVVTNPGFIHARGDRYLRHFPDHEKSDLFRVKSLSNAGIRLAAGSDAPYGPLNPWQSIRAAISRKTQSGQTLGETEALSWSEAIALYCTDRIHPSKSACLNDGAAADIVLLRSKPWDTDDPVAITIINGKIVYQRTAII